MHRPLLVIICLSAKSDSEQLCNHIQSIHVNCPSGFLYILDPIFLNSKSNRCLTGSPTVFIKKKNKNFYRLCQIISIFLMTGPVSVKPAKEFVFKFHKTLIHCKCNFSLHYEVCLPGKQQHAYIFISTWNNGLDLGNASLLWIFPHFSEFSIVYVSIFFLVHHTRKIFVLISHQANKNEALTTIKLHGSIILHNLILYLLPNLLAHLGVNTAFF